MSIHRFVFVLSVVFAIAHVSTGAAQAPPTGIEKINVSVENDWPWWRGPWRNGQSTGPAAPTEFSDTKNVVWKTPVPGRGHASPIVVGDRIALATADEAKQSQAVVAFDRKTGKQLWLTEVSSGGFPRRIHSKNTHASPTVASDGERLFAVFFHHDTIQIAALDWAGKQLWQKTLGHFTYQRYEYGFAPSPVIYRDTVIVTGESDTSSFMEALDRATGKSVWKTPRPVNISYSTPSVGRIGGRDLMIMSGADHVTAYDPATGKELWNSPGTTAATCGTAVWDGDVVVTSGGYPKPGTFAYRAATGELLWKNNQKCYEQSLLAHAGYIYGLTDNGVMYCWQASDGKEMWSQRLRGPVSSSPVISGGHIYWANELGSFYVFKAKPDKFELVAENQLGDDSFPSPAISRGQLFLRVGVPSKSGRTEYLYCIGK